MNSRLVLLILLLNVPFFDVHAQTLLPPVKISNNSAGVEDHQISANGNNIYVVWADNTPGNFEIFFRRSIDGGFSWGSIQNLSNTPSTSRFPRLAMSGNKVYVVWDDYTDFFGSHQILFTRSLDAGATFDPPKQLSGGIGTRISGGIVAANLDNVYVAWGDTPFTGGVGPFLRRSINNGSSFDSLQMFSPKGADHYIAASGNNVYVTWVTGSSIAFTRSTDDGANFGTTTERSPGGNSPRLAISENIVYLIWAGPGSVPPDIFLTNQSTVETPSRHRRSYQTIPQLLTMQALLSPDNMFM